MSDAPVQHKPPHRGILSVVLGWAGTAVTTLLASLLFSLMTEWIGMLFFWPEQGMFHSQQMLMTELMWFADNVRQSLLVADPVALAGRSLRQTEAWMLQIPGLLWLRDRPGMDWLSEYLQAAVYVVMTFVLRVCILVLTAPLFVLAAFTGVIDGLVRRDIRRFGYGYESGFVYHHAKRKVVPVFFLAWVTYLSLPFSVAPWVILLPAAFLFGLMLSITVGSFKKFL